MQQSIWITRPLALFTALLVVFGSATPPPASASDKGVQSKPLGETIQMAFEPNVGQTDEQVAFIARGRGYTAYLTESEAVLSLGRAKKADRAKHMKADDDFEPARSDDADQTVLRMRFAGANRVARIAGLDKLPGTANYFVGNDPSKWRTGIPTYARVRYEGVYDGVDVDLYGNQERVEYDFRVAPGADPAQVRVRFDGAERVDVDESGDLVLRMDGGEIRQQKARVYQEGAQGKRDVSARYTVTGDGEVGFELGSYDPSRTLVIDPVLVYSSYLGGLEHDSCSAIAVDSTGAAYVTGITASTDFPTAGPFQPSNVGYSAFITKVNAAGTALVYSTYLGGWDGQGSGGYDIAVDGSGAAYVAGFTSSASFPVANAILGYYSGGGQDGFVTKLDPTGTFLAYSTYLGGSNLDACSAIAVTSTGFAYVTGATESPNFPTVRPIQSHLKGVTDAFVIEIDQGGNWPIFSTYLGGSTRDSASGIALDGTGAVYVTGSTKSADFPVVSAFQPMRMGTYDAFVTKLNAHGTQFVYSTYLGGSNSEGGADIAVDGSGAAYVTGSTSSTNFPTASPIQATNAGGYNDAFVTKLSAAGTSLVYSTYLGGGGNDAPTDIAVDGNGGAYLTGTTDSANYPTVNPIQATYQGNGDPFVTKLTPAGNYIAYSTYLGGNYNDQGQGIAVDGAGAAFVAGGTGSNNFPTRGPFQSYWAGTYDAFVTKFPVYADTVEFSANSYSVSEGGGVTITVTRAGNNSGTISVDYATSDNVAKQGVDYVPTSGTLTFPEGVTSQTFTVQSIDDAVEQGARALNLTLSAPTAGAAVGMIRRAVLTVVDDDPAGTFEFASAGFEVAENAQTVTVTVNRVNGSAGAVSVQYQTMDNTAEARPDYLPASGTLIFKEGETSATFEVTINDDTESEQTESLHLILRDPTGGATLGSRSRAFLSIVDDEWPTDTFNFSVSTYSVDEGSTATVEITRTNRTPAQTVLFATSDLTAVQGVDYTSVIKPVYFGVGTTRVTLQIPTTPDKFAEGVESVNLTVHDPSSDAPLARAVLTIDDAPGVVEFADLAFTANERSHHPRAEVTVRRVGGSAGTAVVSYATSSNTATAGSDFVSTSGTLTLDPGVTSKTFYITLSNDQINEGHESINLRLSIAADGTVLGNQRRAVAIILDDDQ
jgi:hypothetical protein